MKKLYSIFTIVFLIIGILIGIVSMIFCDLLVQKKFKQTFLQVSWSITWLTVAKTPSIIKNLTISEDGKITLNVLGGKGKKCMDLTKDLEEALGIVESVEKKAEFYTEEESQKESVTVKGGNENG